MAIVIKKTSENLLKNTATSQTINGVTFTVNNDDGTVVANGTSTNKCLFVVTSNLLLSAGSYILSAGVVVDDETRIQVIDGNDTSLVYAMTKSVSETTFTLSEETNVIVQCRVGSGATVSNLVFKPMIRLAKKSEKNLLENTATSKTINGVNFTVNEDYSVTANGTAAAGATFTVVGARDDLRNRLQGKELILTGCPSGGSDSTYRLQCHGYKGDTAQARDRGNGVAFTFTNESSGFNVSIVIATGTVCDNLVFKPMIRLASIEDDTYEPYLDKTPIPYEPYSAYTSSKNLLEITEKSQTTNGVTFTVNDDGTITANGTATENAVFTFNSGYVIPLVNNEEYILTGCPRSDAREYRITFIASGVVACHDYGEGATIKLENTDVYRYALININAGVTVSNLVFKPMIRLASIEDDTYEPYIEPKTLPTSASKAKVIKDGITTFLKTIKVISGGVETVVWKAGAAVTYVVDSGVSYTEDVDGGASCLSPSFGTPTKSGWTFVGWREDTTASADVLTEKLMDDEPITLYAVYSKVILLSYNGNSSTGGSTEQQKDKRYFNAAGTYKDPTFKLSANGFTRTNYTFAAWTQGSASGTQYKAGDSVTLTGSTTFYAYWVETTKSFAYTGGTQPFTAPIAGTYKLVCYGAQGGSGTGAGGKGGYAYGNVSLTKGQTIYVVVGGVGQSPNASSNAGGYNGGGAGCNWDDWRGGSGGGCTHIGTFNKTLASHGSTNGLFIVAGGGGGGGQSRDGGTGAYEGTAGGTGGGTTGGDGVHDTHSGTGGTQSAGGYNKVGGGGYGDRGSFGKGGSAPESLMGGGGGGGLYGGGAGYAGHAAGGGSGYIGGCISGTTGMTNGQQSGNGSASITLVSVA